MNDMNASGYDTALEASAVTTNDGGQTYFVGTTSVVTDFDPAVDRLDLGSDSIHNQIPVDSAEGLVFLHMFDDNKSTLVEGVYLEDLTADNFAPIADAHLQQDLSAALAYENGTGLVRENTVYVRSHEAGLEEVVDFNPATDTISMFYLSVRGDSQLNFSVEETDAGVRFFSPITGQSLTLRGITLDDLDSSHFEWRANQIEDNVAGRMGLSNAIDGFEYDSDNIFSGKSVEMAGLVDRAPYHTQPDYTGTPIGGVTTDPVDPGDDPDDADGEATPIVVTVTGGSAVEADPGVDHTHDDGTTHVHDDGHRFIIFEVSLDEPATEQVALTYTTTDGSAIADTTGLPTWDYHENAGTLLFEPGEQSQNVIVQIHPDLIVEGTETFTLQVVGQNITGTLEATGTIIDNDVEGTTDDGMDNGHDDGGHDMGDDDGHDMGDDMADGDDDMDDGDYDMGGGEDMGGGGEDDMDMGDDGDDTVDGGGDDAPSGPGQTYFVGTGQTVVTDFDPAVDIVDLGGDSIHNQIVVDSAEGVVFLHMFNDSKTMLLEGVYLQDLTASNFAPILDAHLQQDLSASLAYENGTGLVREDTVYVRSHEAGLEEIVDFDPATDTISMFYLSVRGDSQLNFAVEETSEGVRFFSPITEQSITLRGITFDDLDSSHFEWRANQIEDNVAGRMGLSGAIDGFTYENIYSGKSVEMAGLVDRAPYHNQPEYTGTPIGGVTTDPVDPGEGPDDGSGDDPDGDGGDDGSTDDGGQDGGDTGSGDDGDDGDDTGGANTAGAFSPNVSADWGAGYVVQTTFSPAESVSDWTVQLRIVGNVVNIWNASIVAQDGDIYTIEAAPHTASVGAGQQVSFGMQVEGSSSGFEILGQDDGAVDPVDPDPVDPIDPDPVDPDPVDPVDPDPADPFEPEPVDPVDPDPVDPVEPEPVDPVDPDPVDPVEPNPVDPVTGGGDILNGPLSTVGTDIVDADGVKVDLKGANWFGFETDLGTLHGLWARNMEDMLDDIADFGFNMIRLPFAGELAVNDGMPSGIDYASNPDLAGLSSHGVIEAFLDAAEDRGIGVLLDMHRTTPGNGPEGGGLIPDEAAFLDQWATMADLFGDHPAVIGFDLYNEPHGYEWDTWASIAETAGNMLLESNPDELIIVEGVETYEGDTHWWGGNLQGVADRPVELNADNKLVYSPHEYATSVFEQPYFTEAGYDPETTLPEIFRENWGFIEEDGIAPLLLGEFGSTFENATDEAWGPVLADYLTENDIDWSIWSWNPNSGDTGGVVEDDWATPREDAFTFLLDTLLAEGADLAAEVPDDTADDDDDTAVDDDTTMEDDDDTQPADDDMDAGSDEPTGDVATDDSDGSDGLDAAFNIINDWGSGAILELVISNVDQADHEGGWEIDLALNATVSNAWDGAISNNGDGTLTISNAAYNGSVEAGGSVTVGLQIDQGDLEEDNLNSFADFMFM